MLEACPQSCELQTPIRSHIAGTTVSVATAPSTAGKVSSVRNVTVTQIKWMRKKHELDHTSSVPVISQSPCQEQGKKHQLKTISNDPPQDIQQSPSSPPPPTIPSARYAVAYAGGCDDAIVYYRGKGIEFLKEEEHTGGCSNLVLDTFALLREILRKNDSSAHPRDSQPIEVRVEVKQTQTVVQN